MCKLAEAVADFVADLEDEAVTELLHTAATGWHSLSIFVCPSGLGFDASKAIASVDISVADATSEDKVLLTEERIHVTAVQYWQTFSIFVPGAGEGQGRHAVVCRIQAATRCRLRAILSPGDDSVFKSRHWWADASFHASDKADVQKPASVGTASLLDTSVKDLNRPSPEKTQAHTLGLIRPFLSLVAMEPRERSQWASILGVRLPRSGDTHKAALELLTQATHGLHDQVLSLSEVDDEYFQVSSWYELLHCMIRRAVVFATKTLSFFPFSEADLTESELSGPAAKIISRATPDSGSVDAQRMASLEAQLVQVLVACRPPVGLPKDDPDDIVLILDDDLDELITVAPPPRYDHEPMFALLEAEAAAHAIRAAGLARPLALMAAIVRQGRWLHAAGVSLDSHFPGWLPKPAQSQLLSIPPRVSLEALGDWPSIIIRAALTSDAPTAAAHITRRLSRRSYPPAATSGGARAVVEAVVQALGKPLASLQGLLRSLWRILDLLED
eukprot:EG_transcript_4292